MPGETDRNTLWKSLPNPQAYPSLLASLDAQSTEKRQALLRTLIRNDLYFLLRYICRREDMEHGWLFARCREVEASSDGNLDLWARDHRKSSIITFGKTIQDILIDPERTFCILSHTRPIAKKFLRWIMQELGNNYLLKSTFPDILWQDPAKEAPKWSEDDGIVVRRKGNQKESTVEAWGLVDSQPIAAHYNVLIYDDVVVPASVHGPEAIRKTTERWELSLNLSTQGGVKRYIGTRYHYNDTYTEIMKRGVRARVHPATKNGSASGEPVLLSPEEVVEKRTEMGSAVFATQMLLDPRADMTDAFREEWLKFFTPKDRKPPGWITYILVDPAHSKKKESDYTAMAVLGAADDQNLYLLDAVRDRLSLKERTKALFMLHRKWRPIVVGYESYGLQADIEHIEERQDMMEYRFRIVPLGGQTAKPDRIRRLAPYFEAGRVYLPQDMWRENIDGDMVDLTEIFVEEEYKAFPVGAHEDLFDAISRILDDKIGLEFPGGDDEGIPVMMPSPGHGDYSILDH